MTAADTFDRLLKKAHLPRWPASPLAATYVEYASLGLWRAALHLDLFEQPRQKRVFQHPAGRAATLEPRAVNQAWRHRPRPWTPDLGPRTLNLER